MDIDAPPERVFAAVSTPEVAQWWGSAETYRIEHWSMDLRPGGEWRSEGTTADDRKFIVRGTVLEVNPPWLLVHSWTYDWDRGGTTTVRWEVELLGPSASRLTVRQWGLGADAAGCEGHARGWESVLGSLTTHLER